MKPITFDEWRAQFMVKYRANEEIEDVCSDPDDYVFYDNGAVAELRVGDFVIKADQMRRKP